jgi:uncharacterized protein (DUF488 family)
VPVADSRDDERARRVLTIGHSNHAAERFLSLLVSHAVDVVADVRSHPRSRHSPQFNRAALERALDAAGIGYVFLGRELGGRPPEAEYYDAAGHVLYDHLAASARFRSGIDRLLEGIDGHRVAILCAEEDPAKCHRQLLIGRALAGRGVEVTHIRGDGRLQTAGQGELPLIDVARRASKRIYVRASDLDDEKALEEFVAALKALADDDPPPRAR